jgi:hypothetical protein
LRQCYLYGNSRRSYLLAVVVPSRREEPADPQEAAAEKQAIRDEIDRIARENRLQGSVAGASDRDRYWRTLL